MEGSWSSRRKVRVTRRCPDQGTQGTFRERRYDEGPLRRDGDRGVDELVGRSGRRLGNVLIGTERVPERRDTGMSKTGKESNGSGVEDYVTEVKRHGVRTIVLVFMTSWVGVVDKWVVH